MTSIEQVYQKLAPDYRPIALSFVFPFSLVALSWGLQFLASAIIGHVAASSMDHWRVRFDAEQRTRVSPCLWPCLNFARTAKPGNKPSIPVTRTALAQTIKTLILEAHDLLPKLNSCEVLATTVLRSSVLTFSCLLCMLVDVHQLAAEVYCRSKIR
jgi:hypothetical protein